jgi:hypothetical protein
MSLSFYSSAEFKAAMRLVWLALTLVTASTIAAPFVLSDRTISSLAPPCESKRLDGRECILCGTTTGFIAIAHGDWGAAAESNRLAIPLFAAFSANAVAAGAYFLWRSRGVHLGL